MAGQVRKRVGQQASRKQVPKSKQVHAWCSRIPDISCACILFPDSCLCCLLTRSPLFSNSCRCVLTRHVVFRLCPGRFRLFLPVFPTGQPLQTSMPVAQSICHKVPQIIEQPKISHRQVEQIVARLHEGIVASLVLQAAPLQ